MEKIKVVCKKCIYDSNVSGISFDVEGICNYCRQIEKLKVECYTGQDKGIQLLNDIIKEIKEGLNR